MELRRTALALAFALAPLTAAACGDDPQPPATTPTSETTLAAPGSSATSTPGVSTTTTAAPGTIEVSVAGGSITGGGRRRVAVGSTVRLVVRADVADEVHVHGYDLEAPVTPATPATIEFVARIPGVFEVELHKKHQELLQLEVR